MYKQYLNDYEKKADEIRRAARAVETGRQSQVHEPIQIEAKSHSVKEAENVNSLFSTLKKYKTDDILLIVLIFVLISNEERDMTLILILGYLFLSGL